MSYLVENKSKPSIMGSTLAAKEAEEVKVMMYVAKMYPRDIDTVIKTVVNECTRVDLAKKAIYSYPRGNEQVEGPSIRLLEVIARHWGNLTIGVKELETYDDETVAMAFAWDMESNTRDSKIFRVKHVRETKRGNKVLKNPRDIYELVANYGARRKRSCMQTLIPGYVLDKAMDQCRLTVQQEYTDKDYANAINELIKLTKFNKTELQQAIEKRFMKNVAALTIQEKIRLITIANSLRDGMSNVIDWFDLPEKVEVKTKKNKSNSNEFDIPANERKDQVFPDKLDV